MGQRVCRGLLHIGLGLASQTHGVGVIQTTHLVPGSGTLWDAPGVSQAEFGRLPDGGLGLQAGPGYMGGLVWKLAVRYLGVI